MKNKKKIIIIVVVAIALVVTSVISFNLIKKDEIVLSAEDRRALSYSQVTDGGAVEGTEYVKFKAFFLRDINKDGTAESLLGTCKELGSSDNLWLELNVLTDGYLEEGAKITINGNNFKFSTEIVSDNEIKNDYVSKDTKTIEFNRINSGTQKLISGKINSALNNNINNYTAESTITLEGYHVSDDGVRTKIEKTIPIVVDWYGTNKTSIVDYCLKQTKNLDNLEKDDEGIYINGKIITEETKKSLLVKSSVVTGQVPTLMGYEPLSVTCEDEFVSFEYNSENRQFRISRESIVDEDGKFIQQVSGINTYNIKIKYPIEAYSAIDGDAISISIPITAQYEGYNNQNDEFTNPYLSEAKNNVSITYRNPTGENARVNVYIGELYKGEENKKYERFVSKLLPLNLYNNIDNNDLKDEYTVQWYAYTGSEPVDAGLVIEDDPSQLYDIFVKKDATSDSMENYVYNTGIYFYNAKDILGENGWLKLYNANTGELIHEFSIEELEKYNSNTNKYVYDTPIRRVYVETSKYNANSSFSIYHTKEIDDELLVADYSIEEFENLNSIQTTVKASMIYDDRTTEKINTELYGALYTYPVSKANISIDKEWISTQKEQENVNITITTQSTYKNEAKWKDGIFLVKFPKSIVNININSVVSNEVTIDSYELVEFDDGGLGIKIYTSNEVETVPKININFDLACDPLIVTQTANIELYAENGACKNYETDSRYNDIYDINYNSNVEEYVLYKSTGLRLLSPTTLITSQQVSDYDDSGDITIAPKIANIEKKNDGQSAKITVSILNNYNSTITDTKIIGKIPKIDNTYPINGKSMGSEFNNVLQSPIEVPEELKDVVKVYYSYNDKTTTDLNSNSNDWKEIPDDYSKVKSYMIDFGSYTIANGTRYNFNYNIGIDENADINQISYSDHAIYFALNTEEGKYNTQTEPNKLGLRLVKKYNLELSKFEIESDKLIPNTLYKIQDVETKETKTAVTDENGKLLFEGLYAEREYSLKELRANPDYVINNNEVKFIVTTDDNINLNINVISGELKGVPTIDNETATISLAEENEIKYNFKLNKSDINSNEMLAGVKFAIDGGGYVNKIFSTNSNGILNIDGLIPGNTYTLREVEAKGYYINSEEIEFKVVRNSGNLELIIISGSFANNPVISTQSTSDRPLVSIDYANEKIPTYEFELQKVKLGTTEPVKGSKFVLTGPNKKEKVYETDINGLIQIDDFYLYDITKEQDATYTLREIYAPEGYVVNNDTIEFSVKRNSEGLLEIDSFTENDAGIEYSFDQENNKMIVTFPNAPSLKIIKTDADTGERMENVTFEVYDEYGNKIETDSEEINHDISFDYFYGLDKWAVDENGVWSVFNTDGNYGTMYSERFEVTDTSKLSFEWIPEISNSNGTLQFGIFKYSSLEGYSDYENIYSNSLSGIEYSGLIEKNQFESDEIELEPGIYDIGFYAENVDKAIVKNVKLNGKAIIGTEIKTDENGEAKVNMPEGKYILKEKSVSGYKPNNKEYKVGIGKSFNKTKALEFVSSEIVDEYNVKYEEISLGNGYYYERFKGDYLDSEGNIVASERESYDYNYVLYHKDEYGNITGYANIYAYYNEINANQFIVSSDENLILVCKDNYINGEYNREGTICKFDSNLNILKTLNGYINSLKGFISNENGFDIYLSTSYLTSGSSYTIYGKNISVKENGSKSMKFSIDEDLNVLSYEFMDGFNVYSINNDYKSIYVNNDSAIGKEIFGYTITENDIGKTVLFKVSNNSVEVIDRYEANIYSSIERVYENNERKLVIIYIGSDKEIKEKPFEKNSMCFIGYDDSNNIISIQKVSNIYSYISSNSIEKCIDNECYIVLEKNSSSEDFVIDDSVEINSDEYYLLVKYDLNEGKIIGYLPISSYWNSDIKKIDDNKYVFYEQDDYYSNSSHVCFLDNNLNVIVNNKIGISINRYGYYDVLGNIDNVIVLDDNSIVATYNIGLAPELSSIDDFDENIIGEESLYNSEGYYESYLIKYNSDGNLVFIKPINDLNTGISTKNSDITITPNFSGGISIDYLEVDQTDPNNLKYIVYGYTNANEEIVEEGYNKIVYQEIDAYEYPETVVLEVENTKLKHNIYTKYYYSGDFYKGMITGWEDIEDYDYEYKKVEEVVDGANSEKEIVIKPYEGYKISEIMIEYYESNYYDDGYTEYIYPTEFNADGSYVLPLFEDVEKCIYINVSFEEVEAEVQVNHYIKGTETQVAPSKILEGSIDDDYTTSPHVDLDEYELEKDEEGNYILPDNKTGKFTEEKQIVNYYYVKKTPKLIVHHYLEGTEYKLADDEIRDVEYNEGYITSKAEPPAIDERFELVSTSDNTSGIIEQATTEVIYYYNTAHHIITTEVKGVGGDISGNGSTEENPYEVVTHGKDSTKDIIVTPSNGYVISRITINGEEQKLPNNRNNSYTLDKFTNMTEDKHIVVEFKPDQFMVRVVKQWYDDNDINGKRPDKVYSDIYYGDELLDTLELYEDSGVRSVANSTDTSYLSDYWQEYTYIPMVDSDGNLIDISKINAKEREVNSNDLEFYSSEIAQEDYSEEDKELTIYIKNTYSIPSETIEIDVTKKWIDNSNENLKRPSQIKLQVKNGESIVKEEILDVSDLDEQTYTIRGITKYDSDGNEIVYTIDEVEVNEDDFKFYSKEINQENKIITNKFTVPEDKINVEVTKVWNDNSNVNNVRPSQIKLQIKNGETVVQEQIIDSSNGENTQTYSFTNLAKYNEKGQEIIYTVNEVEVNENDLIGYTKSISGTTVTNTIKSYNITTEVNGVGGDISGKEDNPYETVIHGGTSTKDIVITPDEGYEISKITINDVEQTLPTDSDVPYTLDKFENMTEDKHIVVEFKKKEYRITTEVDGDGGTISGQTDNPYETVLHGENSVKDIVVTPDATYKITSITVNGEAITFTPNDNGTYTLDKFINMTEDKHIIVKFEKKDTSVVVKHQTEDGINLVDPETIQGKVDDPYNTSEKEFDDYEIKTIPDNANGTMTEEQIEVIYVYSQVKGKIIVIKVDNSDNSKLSGATFKLEKLDSEGNVDTTFTAQEKTTGDTGVVEFTELLVGKYQITEIKAPEGYELNSEITKVEITKEDRELNVLVKDKIEEVLPLTGDIYINALGFILCISVIGIIYIFRNRIIANKN